MFFSIPSFPADQRPVEGGAEVPTMHSLSAEPETLSFFDPLKPAIILYKPKGS